MEDAKITQEQGSSAGLPVLLTQDDLMLEIGRQVIATRNLEKLTQQLAERIKNAEQGKADGVAATAKAAQLEASNKELSDRNLALDRELTESRKKAAERDKALADLAAAREEIAALQKKPTKRKKKS